jgi:hypothetical protein
LKHRILGTFRLRIGSVSSATGAALKARRRIAVMRDGPKNQTSDAQLRIGESQDSPMCNCTS